MSASQEEDCRLEPFKRNSSLETLLSSLNDSLSCAENYTLANYSEEREDFPLLFVMGPLRSGTTLFMQWLAKSGLAAYPTNLLSRFYGAPVIGAKIQLMLTDPRYNFRNEILDFNSPISFESENGKTNGALAPNEFWYFWRRFIPFQELDWLPDEELFRVVDQGKLVNELRGLTQVFQKPFALKSMILNYNIPFLDAIFKKAVFVQIKRDPVSNIASILEARKRQLGSENQWYSFKIPEYPQLKNLDAVTQSAGQLHFINAAVDKGMEKIDATRKLEVKYEEFCQNPRQVFKELVHKLKLPEGEFSYSGPEEFKISRVSDISNRELIEKALLNFSVE